MNRIDIVLYLNSIQRQYGAKIKKSIKSSTTPDPG